MTIVMKCLWRLLFKWRPRWLSTNKPNGSAAEGKSNFEVERKFRLADNELAPVLARIKAAGFDSERVIEMSDQFLPVQIKGEMLRVRTEVCAGHSETLLTIKEWVIVEGGKERAEEEDKLGPRAASFLLGFGRRISGGPLQGFSKLRKEHWTSSRPGVVVTIDRVSGLGAYSGHYVEIEVLVPRDQNGSVESARTQIAALAREVFAEERAPVEMSYQQMLEKSQAEALKADHLSGKR